MKPLLHLLFLCAATGSFAQSPAVIRQYVETYKDIAVEEMQRTGVPAAITLAQGIHETGAGKSDLVLQSNNHFGIKCKADWQGETVYHDDDARGECFRKYADGADSYRDHSNFLKNRKPYAFLFTLDPLDFEGWAWGLKKAGYATNPRYPQILIQLVNDYNLQDYTLIAMGKKPLSDAGAAWVAAPRASNQITAAVQNAPAVPAVTYPQGIFKINETEVLYVPKGRPYLAVAEENHISLSRLYDFNDLPQLEAAPDDGLVYLRRKRKHGVHETYTVLGAESLHQIAQAEGLRLQSLLEYNFLTPNMQPAPGSVLYLQQKAPAPPAVAVVNFGASSGILSVGQAPADTAFFTYTVQPKETAFGLAKRFGVSIENLLAWNHLESADLHAGQQLRIRKKNADGAD